MGTATQRRKYTRLYECDFLNSRMSRHLGTMYWNLKGLFRRSKDSVEHYHMVRQWPVNKKIYTYYYKMNRYRKINKTSYQWYDIKMYLQNFLLFFSLQLIFYYLFNNQVITFIIHNENLLLYNLIYTEIY